MAPKAQQLNEPHLPNLRDVVRQTYYDLLQSKDVQDNPTFTYTWLADQFGHFTLGFLPTFVISWIVDWLGLFSIVDPGARNVIIGICVFGIWIFKEVRDFVLARLAASRSESDFKFNGTELAWNVLTAWTFFAMGSIVAVLSFIKPVYALAAIPPCLIVTALMSYWWLSRKITFQQAALPYLYRLANFPNNIPDEFGSKAPGTPEEKRRILSDHVRELLGPAMPMAKAEATAFITDRLLAPTLPESWLGYSLLRGGFSRGYVKSLGFKFPKCEPAHLILAGMPNAGKSSLAVGIGTEFVFKLGLARYLTLATLLDVALERDAAEKAKAFAVKKAMERKAGMIDYEESLAEELQAQEADAMTKGKPEPPRAIRDVEEFNDGRVIWKWSEVQMLIVDDVDDVARVTHDPESLTPDGREMYNQTVAAILKTRFGSVIQDLKKIPRTIWICNQLIAKEAVKGYLEQILGFENVGVIYLEDTIEEAQRKKAEKRKGIK